MPAAVPAKEPDQYTACHCLCGLTHPDAKGICDTFNPVTTRHYSSELVGERDVPLCAPCATASGVPVTRAAGPRV